jgi:predicted amidohydrolase YtcJ
MRETSLGHCLLRVQFIVFAVVVLASCGGTEDEYSDISPAADTILINGRIHTLNGDAEPLAQAIAIYGGKILAVGDNKAIEGQANGRTRVVDLDGKTVLPGFHDFHVHPIFAGLQHQQCRIPQGSNLAEIQRRLKACVEKAEPGAWVIGGQWDKSAVGQTPHKSLLDVVAPDNPVLLGDTSEHSAWVNSKALAIAQITAAVESPKGGVIEKDDFGEPSGVLHEYAVGLVKQHIPPPPYAQVRKALIWSLDKMLSHGITSFTEASTGYAVGVQRELELFAALADEGELKHRIRFCIPWATDNVDHEVSVETRQQYVRERLNPDCVKVGLDGVPTESHTAAMLEPYAGYIEGRADEASVRGILMVEQQKLNDAVTRFDQQGLTVKFHAAGDAAVRAGLDAVEAARTSNGMSSQRHNIAHGTFVKVEDIARAKELQATFEVSPYLFGPTPINDSIANAVGNERMERIWPVRDMLESGSLVVPGSDWAVVPSVNPWIAVETLVTREQPGGSETSVGKSGAITLDEAIRLFTVNGAKHMGNEDKLGKIAAGMIADLVVLDQDPYAVPVKQLHKTKVEKTIINGEIVFDRSQL